MIPKSAVASFAGQMGLIAYEIEIENSKAAE